MTYEAFKSVIRASGYTMEELSDKLGMSRPTLQKRLQRPYSMTIEQADKIAEILSLSREVVISPK